jgi:hypothetical protein
MTMTVFGEQFGGKQLQLVKKNGNAAPTALSWAKYPVHMTGSELRTIKDQTALVSVMSDSFKTPSQMAGIPSHKIICQVIHFIDKEFRKAKLEYQQKLALAEGDDLKQIREMEQKYSVKDYGGWFGWIFRVLEALGGNFKSEKEVAKEGSAHRIRWMYEVDSGESNRMKKIKEELQKAMSAIVKDIDARAAKKVVLVDTELMRKARQLVRVYKAIFPSDTTNVDVKKMEDAIKALPPKMAALLDQT